MKTVIGALVIGMTMIYTPVQYGGYCRWICSSFGPVWHCDERAGPFYPPNYPPPRCGR